MSIIIFIISLAVLIFVHELGHFSVAKFFGVKVEEFGLGLPPRAFGKKIGETIYSLNWIPFGGFVKIFGEDPDTNDHESFESTNGKDTNVTNPPNLRMDTDEDVERALFKKPRFVQASVLVAGVTFNIIFAWLILSFGFVWGLPTSAAGNYSSNIINSKATVTQIMQGSPAEKAGLLSGDTILSMQNQNIKLEDGDLIPEKISDFTSKSSGPISISYVRGTDAPKNISVLPSDTIIPGRRAIGVGIDQVGILKLSPLDALLEGGRTTIKMITGIGAGFLNLVRGAKWSEVTGPVGLAKVVGQASKLGFAYFISLIAMISINLAVLNLIPFPALDGGRLFILAIEAIIRRPIKPSVVQKINATGFVALLILMAVVTIHDILRI